MPDGGLGSQGFTALMAEVGIHDASVVGQLFKKVARMHSHITEDWFAHHIIQALEKKRGEVDMLMAQLTHSPLGPRPTRRMRGLVSPLGKPLPVQGDGAGPRAPSVWSARSTACGRPCCDERARYRVVRAAAAATAAASSRQPQPQQQQQSLTASWQQPSPSSLGATAATAAAERKSRSLRAAPCAFEAFDLTLGHGRSEHAAQTTKVARGS
jgi:hypothetical protein